MAKNPAKIPVSVVLKFGDILTVLLLSIANLIWSTDNLIWSILLNKELKLLLIALITAVKSISKFIPLIALITSAIFALNSDLKLLIALIVRLKLAVRFA